VAMWMPYKNHRIKACSQQLLADRWMPIAVAWLPAESHESIHTIQAEVREICKTEGTANVMALDKAKNWVDQQSID
jgi:hypothetical protein